MTYHLKVAGLERELPLCKVDDSMTIAAFVISLRIGELVRRDGRMWLLPLALGLLYMLADFLTFRLANMLAFDKINLPQWDLFFIGAAISALGLLIGRLLGRRRSKPA